MRASTVSPGTQPGRQRRDHRLETTVRLPLQAKLARQQVAMSLGGRIRRE